MNSIISCYVSRFTADQYDNVNSDGVIYSLSSDNAKYLVQTSHYLVERRDNLFDRFYNFLLDIQGKILLRAYIKEVQWIGITKHIEFYQKRVDDIIKESTWLFRQEDDRDLWSIFNCFIFDRPEDCPIRMRTINGPIVVKDIAFFPIKIFDVGGTF